MAAARRSLPVRSRAIPVLDDLPVDPRRQMGRSGPGQARTTPQSAAATPADVQAPEPVAPEEITPQAPEATTAPAPAAPAPEAPQAAAPAEAPAAKAPPTAKPKARKKISVPAPSVDSQANRPKIAAPKAEAPAAEAAEAPAAEAEAPADAKGAATAKGKDDKTPGLVPHVEPPKPGAGPRIISVPEPPKRPKRDETQSQPSGQAGRPTRGGMRSEGGPAPASAASLSIPRPPVAVPVRAPALRRSVRRVAVVAVVARRCRTRRTCWPPIGSDADRHGPD